MVLCKLAEQCERTVGDLAGDVGLSQSALSQHLARMRDEELVAFRRESQTLWYRIADPRTEALLAALYQLYCQEDRSEEHTSELQSLMRISYAVFCLKKKKPHKPTTKHK